MIFKKIPQNSQYHYPHILLILIDGLTSNAAVKFKDELVKRTSYNLAINLQARAIIPALSAPNIASIITGAPLEFHAIDTFNGVNKEVSPIITNESKIFPTLFWHCFNHNYSSFLYTPTSLLLNLVEKQQIAKIVTNIHFNSEEITNQLNTLIPNLFCFYFNSLNKVGINYGFDKPQYFNETKIIFNNIINVVNNLKFKKETIIIIASTHGGIDQGTTSTGGLSDNEMLIPHLILGNNIKTQNIANYYNQTDLALLIAMILNFDLPQATRTKLIPNLFGDDNDE